MANKRQVSPTAERQVTQPSLSVRRDHLTQLLTSITSGGLVRNADGEQAPASVVFIERLDEYIRAAIWEVMGKPQLTVTTGNTRSPVSADKPTPKLADKF